MAFQPRIGGLLLKTSPERAKRLVDNWRSSSRPQAFLLFDRVPVLDIGKPVFTHVSQEKHIGFVGDFVRSEIVRGYKPLESDISRMRERERVWQDFKENQLHTARKSEFDSFWEEENGVRSLVLVRNLVVPPMQVPWRDVQKVIYTGYFRGVGYLYLLEEECRVLRELCFGPSDEISEGEGVGSCDALAAEVAQSCYAASIDMIPRVLKEGPMTTAQICDEIRMAFRDLCDDTIPCVHHGKDYGQPEWRHQVRSAQQSLKRAGKIQRDARSRTWVLCKSQ